MSKLHIPHLLVSMLGLSLVVACRPVPLSGDNLQREQRPVKPLYDQPVKGEIAGRKQQSGFQVASPTAKQSSKPANAQKSSKPTSNKGQLDVSQQLADAADKAASAKSLAQSAQTKDDWNLVFRQWKRAISILKKAPSQTAAVKQRIAEYNKGLVQATRDAKVSLNPSLAPVDPTGSKAIRVLIGTPSDPQPKPTPTASPNPSTKTPSPQTSKSDVMTEQLQEDKPSANN